MNPRNLPRLRDGLVRHLTNPNSAVRTKTGAENQEALDGLTRNAREARLFWASEDMTALAVSAGRQLDDAYWGAEARPAPAGLILFDSGVGTIEAGAGARRVEIPVEACAWGPHPQGCLLWLLISRQRLQHESGPDVELIVEQTPPLIPIWGTVLDAAEPVPMTEIDPKQRTVVATLAAAWLLMAQPTLVETGRERASGRVRRSYVRAGRPEPEITLVHLRRQYGDHSTPSPDPDSGGRYRYRWVVSGHWRNQPYGPGHSRRRRQWIPAYIKGPDGAPILARERVNVWRR